MKLHLELLEPNCCPSEHASSGPPLTLVECILSTAAMSPRKSCTGGFVMGYGAVKSLKPVLTTAGIIATGSLTPSLATWSQTYQSSALFTKPSTQHLPSSPPTYPPSHTPALTLTSREQARYRRAERLPLRAYQPPEEEAKGGKETCLCC